MELRQLRYLVSAARCGSIKDAALENHVTSPAVSVQLKLLEGELGEKLIVADRHGVRLTHAGDVVRGLAEDVLRRVESIHRSVQSLRDGDSGFLAMGNIDAASIYVLPKVFAAFRRRYPNIDVRVVVADSSRLLEALDREEIELCIVTLPGRPLARVELHPIYEEELVAVAHPTHELAGRRTVALGRLAAAGIITYPARSTTRALIDQVFAGRGLRAKPLMEITSPEAMRELAEAGLGASILPGAVVASALKQRSLVRLSCPKVVFRRVLALACRDTSLLSPPARSFVRVLRQHVRPGDVKGRRPRSR